MNQYYTIHFEMKTVVIFFGLLALVKGQTTSVSPCFFYSGQLPINTYVEDCITPPCRIVQGGTAAINIVFRAPRTIRSMTTLAAAFLAIIPINYGLGEDAVTCNHLTNTYCPVLEGEIVTYTLRLTVDPNWPSITVPIEFRIMDESNSSIMCLRMNVAVASAARSGGNSTLTLN